MPSEDITKTLKESHNRRHLKNAEDRYMGTTYCGIQIHYDSEDGTFTFSLNGWLYETKTLEAAKAEIKPI